jgi:hypothetical protein
LQLAPPQVRTWFGVERRHAQPAVRFADGTTVSLY